MADRVQATDWIAARSTLIRDLKREGGLSDAALEAMGAVPRHEFIPATKRQDSYANHPVPIGLGQTISQPDMVGWLADAVGAAAASVVTVEANHTATRHGEGVECGSTGLFTG
ncbi:MAG: hypothetical protein FJ167_04515 [Gammaproteobacteria bacterium]|nr:hypothetical protein [Gammaproteobacteria bacterium]